MLKRVASAFALCVLLSAVALSPSAGAIGEISPEAHSALRLFTRALALVELQYVEDVDVKDLVYGAITGMVTSLDPHSDFLTAEQFQMMNEDTKGEFGGLGIEVSGKDGYVVVVSPIDDTPAQRAGIKAGDLIVKIDGVLTKGLGMDEAVKRMRGEPGTSVTLTIWREGGEKPFEVSIVRDVIKSVSVKHRELEPGFGYVRIAQFRGQTTEKLVEAIRDLQSKPEGLKGLVVDLRNDPGGLLDEAVGVADEFLSDGLVVYTAGRMPNQNMTFPARPGGAYLEGPLVVLVNGASASASEIVAGALKDRKRAVIVGSRTFGKASVQTIMPIDEGTALRLTTAKYFTPSGTDIQAKGIVPVVWIRADGKEGPEDADAGSFSEADYPNRLKNVEEEGAEPEFVPPTAHPDIAPLDESGDESAPSDADRQLDKAIEILKNWSQYDPTTVVAG